MIQFLKGQDWMDFIFFCCLDDFNNIDFFLYGRNLRNCSCRRLQYSEFSSPPLETCKKLSEELTVNRK